MSYFKMLGFGFGGDYSKIKINAASGSTSSLFSTAVISGSSSAPNLRDMIPNTASVSSLDGFGGVPPIRPLETLHNALSLKKLDTFLERVTFTPLFRTPASSPPKHPSTPLPTQSHKIPSPTNSVGWSGPSSLMSSSGGPASGVSSSGPSSPNCFSDFHSRGSSDMSASQVSTDGYSNIAMSSLSHILTLPELDTNLHSVNVELDTSFGSGLNVPSSKVNAESVQSDKVSISGDITPVSISSDWEFNTNEATFNSVDHDYTVTEEDDEEEATLSLDTNMSNENISAMPKNFICKPQGQDIQIPTSVPIVKFTSDDLEKPAAVLTRGSSLHDVKEGVKRQTSRFTTTPVTLFTSSSHSFDNISDKDK